MRRLITEEIPAKVAEDTKSRIVINAHRINAGQMPEFDAGEGESDFYFVPAEDPEQAEPQLRATVRRGLLKVEQLHALARAVYGGQRGRLSAREVYD